MTIAIATSGWRDLSFRKDGERSLRGCVQLLEIRLPYLLGRAERLEAAACVLGQAAGLSEDEMRLLLIAARFLDIGLTGVPDSLLLRAGPLTPGERARVAMHTDLGGRLVARVYPDFPEAAEAIWFHHETVDGQGPHRLQAEDVPQSARLLALLDAVESMVNARPHRPALPLGQVIQEVQLAAGRQFDPSVTKLFLDDAERIYTLLSFVQSVPDKAPASSAARARTTGATARGQRKAGVTLLTQSPDAQVSAAWPASAAGVGVARSLVELEPLMSEQDMCRLIKDSLHLRPLAPIVHSIMKLTASSQCTAEDVAKEVIHDQAISIRILKLANSSAYTRGRPISGIRNAVSRVGLQEVRKLVMTLGVMEQYKGRISERLDPRLFWEHAIACGLIGTSLARACQIQAPEDYFLYGMVHDVGRMILLEQMPDLYAKVWDTAEELNLPLEPVESRLLGMDHADILRQALECWCFPKEFVFPVINHHKSPEKLSRLPKDQVQPAVIMALANRLAQALLLGSSGRPNLEPVDALVSMLGLSQDVISRIVEQTPDETSDLKVSMLTNDDADDWPEQVVNVRAAIGGDLRPLCVSLEPAMDTFAMFCRRIARQAGEQPPNLGVLYLQDGSQLAQVRTAYLGQERQAGPGALPLIIICGGKAGGLDTTWLRGRQRAVLEAPVSAEQFVSTIQRLLQ